MKIVPNSFFLGMADLAMGWEWVDGVFAESAMEPGWNEITYKLSDSKRNKKESGKNKLYISIFKDDEEKEDPLARRFLWME